METLLYAENLIIIRRIFCGDYSSDSPQVTTSREAIETTPLGTLPE
jgi:hypothetical protein